MLVEGLCRRSGIPVPEGVSDALRGEAVHVRNASAVGIKVRRSIEEAVPMQDGQRTPDGTRVAFRYGTLPQQFRRVVRPEAEELCEEFECPLLGRVAAGKHYAALRGCLRVWRHPIILGFRGRGARWHGMPPSEPIRSEPDRGEIHCRDQATHDGALRLSVTTTKDKKSSGRSSAASCVWRLELDRKSVV